MIRKYSELIKIDSYIERFRYAKIGDGPNVGESTFGWQRYLNQNFYSSREWKQLRQAVIVRDMGLDLGFEGYEIGGLIIVHHLNPIRPEDIVKKSSLVFDPENLICVSKRTHDAIHFGDEELLWPELIVRTPGDTLSW